MNDLVVGPYFLTILISLQGTIEVSLGTPGMATFQRHYDTERELHVPHVEHALG